MSQAPASLLKELQNGYFCHSEPLCPERKGLQPTWEDHHIQIRWWGFKLKANKLFRLRTGKRWYQKGKSRRESPQKRVPLIHKTKTRWGHHGWGSRPFITRDLGREKYAPQIHDTINNPKSRTERRYEWIVNHQQRVVMLESSSWTSKTLKSLKCKKRIKLFCAFFVHDQLGDARE